MQSAIREDVAVRALARDDLKSVMAIDQAASGHPRHRYFERRLAAAVRLPAAHAQFALSDADGLAGYLLARIVVGEFGRIEPGLRIEAIGVRPDVQQHGLGQRLLAALTQFSRRKGIREIRTAAAWSDHGMLRWFDAMGFTLASNHIVDCRVGSGGYVARPLPADADAEQQPATEVNYGESPANDFEKLSQAIAEIRSMTLADLPDIVRIDRSITGRDRHDYMRDKFNDAMDETAIRVSLTARSHGAIVGFLMARADLGDFGRAAPVAILDTIGVDPAAAHHGIGHALLSQLFVNLDALRIERVETVVAPRDLQLLGFLYEAGFTPSQRLPFLLRVA